MKIMFSFLIFSAFLGTPMAHAKEHMVIIENMKFSPESLTVDSGDSVTWVNKDFFPHTATSDKKQFDSKEIAANAKWTFKAKAKGQFPYTCKLHPTMKAHLTVQ